MVKQNITSLSLLAGRTVGANNLGLACNSLYINVNGPLTLLHASSKGADQPVDPHRLTNAFSIRSLKRIISKYVPCEISIFWLVCIAEQVGLSLI